MNCRLEVVAICDHLVAFGAAELENKIGGKALGDTRGDNACRSFSLLRDDVLPLPVFPELPDHYPENLDVALGTNDGISLVLRPQYDTALPSL